MAALTLGYEGITIRASLEQAAEVQWLEEFLLPWFDRPDVAPDVEVLVTHDPAYYEKLLAYGPTGTRVNAFMMDTRIIDFPCWSVPGNGLAFHDESHRIFFIRKGSEIKVVCAEPGSSSRMNIMRVLRELAMGAAQLSGGRFLHASSVAAGGRALVITGPRQAGKTSLLTYLLANSQAQFLCNDRLLVRQSGGTVELRGMPTIVSIRDGTLDLFPGMRHYIEDQRFSTRATLAEAHSRRELPLSQKKEGRLSLSPRQYAQLLNLDPVQGATGAALIFPRQTGRSGGLELVALAAAEASNRLEHSLFGHIGPDSLSDALTFLPERAAGATAPDDATLRTWLAQSLPAYDCFLGNDTYGNPRGAAILMELLRGPGAAPTVLRPKAGP